MGIGDLIKQNRQDINWQEFAKVHKGEYLDGGMSKSDRVWLQYKEWNILLDTYSNAKMNSGSRYTRFRIPLYLRKIVRFNIQEAGGWGSMLNGMFGSKAMPILKNAAKKYQMSANHPTLAKPIAEDEQLWELILALPTLRLSIEDDNSFYGPPFPEDMDQLELDTLGIIRDQGELEGMLQLIHIVLDKLVQMQIIREKGIKLDYPY